MPKEKQQYTLKYSIINHYVLGYLVEPYAIELNKQGQPTLNHVRLYSHTLKSYIPDCDELDQTLIDIMDEYSLEALGKKFNKKIGQRPTEFFQKIKESEIEYILPVVQDKINQVLSLMAGKKTVYLKGSNDNPLQTELQLTEDPASIHFHFKKQDDGLRYYPTIKYRDELIHFRNEECRVICNEPCWFLVGNHLHHFEQLVEGKKLIPFIDKPCIFVPKKHEAIYFSKFVFGLMENYPVVTHNLPLKKIVPNPKAELGLGTTIKGKWAIFIYFNYKGKTFQPHNRKERYAQMSKNSDPDSRNYEIELVYRNEDKEDEYINILKNIGLEPGFNGAFYINSNSASPDFTDYVEWINKNHKTLENKGFKPNFVNSSGKEYFIGQTDIDFQITEKNDWFDIDAKIRFGEHLIPFHKLKKHILQGIREYELPDGTIAILPNEWFARYKDLFVFGGMNKKGDKLQIKKHHYLLLEGLSKNSKENSFQKKLDQLSNKEGNNVEIKPPESLKAELRNYQLEGLQWLYNLYQTKLGGCLADDMGLGKTVQTIALLGKIKEEHINAEASYPPSMIIMPASLIHNWKNEILKFDPTLTVFEYTGSDRKEDMSMILRVDIVLTTYGTIRNDIDEFKDYIFNYVILDESQAIKNPTSKIARAVSKIYSNNKLVLTGTPIENTLTDLWSQMHFINPGLLGGYKFFKNNYAAPIEKKKDDESREKLKKLIDPFILRRTKGQVAKELPSLTQKTHYCEMTDDQAEAYEKVKSSYRNQILQNIEEQGIRKSQFLILRGLTQLRLLANHPRLLNTDSGGTSGKFDEVLAMMESIIEEDHKILIYSQFVKHLNIFKEHFENTGINYSYFVGSSRNRQEILDDFINNDDKQVILISLKAGGSGLNLMAADYVFLLDPWWNPAVEQQAINRAHRIGQDKKVFSYRFITRNSIEEKIMQLQQRKAELSSNLIQPVQNFAGSLDLDDVKELLQ